MDHTENLTRYTANFTDELARQGVENAVISPGSRSTPLALMLTEHEAVKEWVILDERSAAFFALGLAKETNSPVALLCTSGTAAANYYPAIVEAHYSRVPLIVLTADRPHELREVGAPQAIEQRDLYGEHVKWFHDMALPEATVSMLHYVRSKAARSVYMAKEGNPGPVHLNFPFREPLMPDFSLKDIWNHPSAARQSAITAEEGGRFLDPSQVEQIMNRLQNKERGIIVCGPQTDESLATSIADLAAAWNIPILADPLSQLRAGKHSKSHVIEAYDAFLRNKEMRASFKPDFILRFGAMPVSKPYLFFVKENGQTDHFIIEHHSGYREPAGINAHFIYADPAQLCDVLVEKELSSDGGWMKQWLRANEVSKKRLTAGEEAELTEGEAVLGMLEAMPDGSRLYTGNSMSVRDVDTFFLTTDKNIRVHANRGANGIDGMVSSGMGAAAAGETVTLLLGDLSFFHDMNGLLAAKHYTLNITILLINNNGGGIFSFLPHLDKEKHFEALFGTPPDIDFQYTASMYGGTYRNPANLEELMEAFTKSYQHEGLSIIEVNSDRTMNAEWHRKKWRAIEEELLAGSDD
ncbi:2-succinyl-5-enolpyruvyl-6-hydroxy-3-cyclohexene-1-carboxylic-acid synthase [Virgibacillus xinjiangensis]|uniref:2-succinyl-5-enolpyruvyl-6-hydroxy-3-cyclohexene-1-carboxylate synthase n=1 Tax=Virgibacillus xinjiangensis TaxID=393090 RepID=A0ABV7CY41_9BACI